MKTKITKLQSKHLPQLNSLIDQLGYPASLRSIQKRYQALSKQKHHRLLVAVDGEKLIGWLHLEVVHALLYELRLEIRALVVHTNARGHGIGKKLILEAKRWAKKKKIKTIYLRTNIKRKGAHRFYERIGFDRTKKSYKYEIKV